MKDSDMHTLCMTDGAAGSNYTDIIYGLIPELKTTRRGTFQSERFPELKNVVYIGQEKYRGMYNTAELLLLGGKDVYKRQLSGLLSALAAWVITSRIASARPDIGTGYELQAITIAVLGGISIQGGEGTVGGVLLSVAIITMLNNGLQLAGIHQIWQLGALGLVLIGSVLLNQFLIRRRKI